MKIRNSKPNKGHGYAEYYIAMAACAKLKWPYLILTFPEMLMERIGLPPFVAMITAKILPLFVNIETNNYAMFYFMIAHMIVWLIIYISIYISFKTLKKRYLQRGKTNA